MPSQTVNLRLLFQAVCWLAFLLVLSGCQLVKKATQVPNQVVTAVTPGAKKHADPAGLQVQLQRFADEYSGRTIAAMNRYAADIGTEQAFRQTLRWKVMAATSAVTIASGPNPQVNLLDFLALTTVTRMALEDLHNQPGSGPHFESWLEVSRSLETNIWAVAADELTPAQSMEIRDAIQRWRANNQVGHEILFARPEELGSIIRQPGIESSRPESVFALVGLDPTAGLDPAVREVTRTRLFAERAMFMLQRMPFLLRWQIELLTDDLLGRSQIAELLKDTTRLTTSIDRLSHAAASASATAAMLPDRLTAERQAILNAFEEQESKLRALSTDLTRTLAAGEQMSTSLNNTLLTFDHLMKRFGVGEPAQISSPPPTNSPPFNILDYAETAERIAAMAAQIDLLLKDTSNTLDSPALDRRIAELNAVTGKARADAMSVLNHAFLLAAGLVLIVLAAAMVFRIAQPRNRQ